MAHKTLSQPWYIVNLSSIYTLTRYITIVSQVLPAVVLFVLLIHSFVDWKALTFFSISLSTAPTVVCPNHQTCPEGTKCCRDAEATVSYYCCTYEKGHCCPGGMFCCDEGYRCDLTRGLCYNNVTNKTSPNGAMWSMRSSAKPSLRKQPPREAARAEIGNSSFPFTSLGDMKCTRSVLFRNSVRTLFLQFSAGGIDPEFVHF